MKIIEKIKKYKILFLTSILVIAVGIAGIVLYIQKDAKISKNTLETSEYYLQYDDTWKVKENTDKTAKLSHDENASLALEITKLDNQYEFTDITDMIDEIIYNINQTNTEYHLINSEERNLTQNEYPGYRLLYENNENEVLISIFKTEDKLISLTYEAESNCFDMILDSVNTIIFNFKLKENQIDLNEKFDIETRNLELNDESDLNGKLTEKTEYEIANNNYHVKYSIPKIFKEHDYNSKSGYYTYTSEDYSKTINISTYIFNKNIYEEIDGEKSTDIKGKYSSYKDNEEFEESVSKESKDGYETVIYKNQYYTDPLIGDEKIFYENLVIIYPLNYNHILEITISAIGMNISKELIDSITLNSVNNYSSYIVNEIDENNILSKLKRKIDIDGERKTEEVTLKLPKKYIELDSSNNIYEERKFGLDYNEDLEVYDYEVDYWLRSGSTESIIDSANSMLSSYGEKEFFEKIGNNTYNNKEFEVYSGSEVNLAGIMYTNINRTRYTTNKTILIHKLPDGKLLVITIKGNNKTITDEILNELTNFNQEIK